MLFAISAPASESDDWGCFFSSKDSGIFNYESIVESNR